MGVPILGVELHLNQNRCKNSFILVEMFSEIAAMSSEPSYTRRHHPPDDIVDGKPKWVDIKLRGHMEDVEDNDKVQEREISIDRLNPTRKMIEELEEGFKDEAEEAQKVLVNMVDIVIHFCKDFSVNFLDD